MNWITQLNRKAKANFGRQHFDHVRSGKDFWSSIGKFGIAGCRSSPPTELDSNIININSYFASLPDSNSTPIVENNISERSDAFFFRNVTMDELSIALFRLKSNAVGLDNINLKFIKLIFPAFGQHFLCY